MSEIEGRSLTTFEVTPDGRRCRLNFIDATGQPAALTLPADCLGQLLMTLPQMISQSLRARHQDSSLRLVFPAAEWRLEYSGTDRMILTIGTNGGFEVSFAIAPAHLRDMVDTPKDEDAVEATACRSLN